MNYYELTFYCTPNTEVISEEVIKDVLTSLLGDLGFESFSEDESAHLLGYISETLFSEEALKEMIDHFPLSADISFSQQLIITRNWNEEWEKHFFQPIIIDRQCAIHSTFHKDIPPAKYDIIIDPKMSFGTGHHETTELMISFLLDMEVREKSVLDMGCGTAVLAILAAMKGANPVLAVDNDEWAYNNAIENRQLNHTENISVVLGDAQILGNEKFDVILANINRNILLNDIHRYAACLHAGGILYMSGFYTEDIPAIKEVCEKSGLNFLTSRSKRHWAAVEFRKNVPHVG
ncbi:MAG: 50S ribosomal protein L11 methyltransferase [Dysgonamonadaceae bacterium]|jgi:ribosomal protein L11 methyltransferase|nr:50S ribosomal protein L11 methyltransferase [Dysgonamonadaceae bacterium]